MRLKASYRWCMVSPGASRGIPDSLHQRLWPFIPTRGFLGTVWWLSSRGHPTVCLGLPCKVWIIRLSASHRHLRVLTPLVMRSLMIEVDEHYAWLIVLCNLVCTRWLILVKVKPTRTCAKILKVRTYSLLLFSKRKPVAKKPFMYRVGEVVITDG
jgi:hypothetical protein